ncbi:hypothetical protein ABOM_011917 [Aspergillus bombycis]|uniref:Uncharacterized protein n=1 Tax=Aspergillus bombycis TaxID=109264 RepID=A0A1F7ZJB2_9EURO|nr:hypothetical protein ABOM_011917 [Aspergillus bombycis]OGM39533.1 hypothetical protein ABOM_011917 [Aspergillus bombycis]
MENSKSRSSSPALPRENVSPSSSGQIETLTEEQHALINSIGNKQLASRLHKRTLKIFTREERLDAIEFYRTHVHINPQTGEEHNISVASASEVLHISTSTLEKWINEETKITAMKCGNSRDDGGRYLSAAPMSERFASGHYPFLRLTPEQLSAKKYIQGKDLYKVHPITHPVPFISIEGGRRGKIKSFADAYKFLGQAEGTSHPGHPREPGLGSEIRLRQPINEAAAPPCLESSSGHSLKYENPTIQKVNSLLYHLAPDYSLRQPGLGRCTPCYKELGACVSVICEHLVTASDKLESAIPVRIGFDYDEPFEGAPPHWAIKLLHRTKFNILLPLSLCLRGSVKQEVVPDTLLLQGWTTDYEILKCRTRKRQRNEDREHAIRYSQEFYRKSEPIFEKFRLVPVLYIEDIEMLFLKSQSWRPRRFSPTWTLYSTVLHSSYRSGDTLTPIYGKYTDIGLIVDAIVTKAPQVSFSAPAVRPFQLVSLDHFSLIPQVSENTVLSQFSKHLEISDTPPSGELKLEYIEETLAQDAQTTCKREFRKKLVHALKLSVRKSLEHINGKKRCLYYTCPESQEAPVSYYCRHHSEALVNYVMDPVEPLDQLAYHVQKREVNITDETQDSLRQLKILHERPEKTWILDFEYISLPKRYSPIPLQLAIRQLDGKLLYQGNIDYGLSMKEFMDATSSYVSAKHGMMGTLFLRCYGGLNTNGETSHQVRDQIITVCGYNPKDTKILSWFAAQDMQCFLRILAGGNELVQEKVSHEGHDNFQTINIGLLCRKLFPGLPSTTLQSVHEFMGASEGYCGEYHTAVYDTKAMAAIVKALVQLL